MTYYNINVAELFTLLDVRVSDLQRAATSRPVAAASLTIRTSNKHVVHLF